jgi:hypothetical protein
VAHGLPDGTAAERYVGEFPSQEMLDHEAVHFEQMDRDGTFTFVVKYLYYWVRFGYDNNPYEIEAYGRGKG